jgi:hypothetical protein
MNISSPCFVIAVILAVFAVATYIGATTREDGPQSH